MMNQQNQEQNQGTNKNHGSNPTKTTGQKQGSQGNKKFMPAIAMACAGALALGAVPASAATVSTDMQYYGGQSRYVDTTPETRREHQRLHQMNIPHERTRFDRTNRFDREHDRWERQYAYSRTPWDDRYRDNRYGYGSTYGHAYGYGGYDQPRAYGSGVQITGRDVIAGLIGVAIGTMIDNDGRERQYYLDQRTNRYYYYDPRTQQYYWDYGYRRE